MNKLSTRALYFVVAILLLSCTEKTSKELTSTSGNKQNEVKVKGVRITSFDPFQTSIVINGFAQSDTLMTEIYATGLTEKTVNFAWANDNSCTVTFIQQDDSQRNLTVKFDEGGNAYQMLD